MTARVSPNIGESRPLHVGAHVLDRSRFGCGDAHLIVLAAVGGTDDIRDLIVYLAEIHFSATKLGLDTRQLFEDIAALTPSADLQGGRPGRANRANRGASRVNLN